MRIKMHRLLKYILGGLGFRGPAAILLAVTGLVLNDCARAADEIVHNYALYYLLGGERATDIAASERRSAQALSGPRAPLGSACSGFNRTTDILDLLSGSLENSLIALSSVPREVSSALPGSILCRAKPGACQLLQHYLVRAEDRWKTSVDECRQDLNAAARSDSPRQDLLDAARTEIWEIEASRGASAAAAKSKADATDGCVTWLGNQKAGCQGAPAIWLLRDTTSAGWCLLLNQPGDCTSATPSSERSEWQSPLRSTWDTPDAAGSWVVKVLGDYRIQAGEAIETVPGEGLLPQIDQLTSRLSEQLTTRVYDTGSRSEVSDFKFKGAGVILAEPVIDALRDLPDRDFLIRRLANEAALAEIVEQAFLARRLLLSGLMEPHIQRGGGVAETVANQVKVLEREIDRASWELQARRHVVSATILELLSAHEALLTPAHPQSAKPKWRLE